MSVSIAPIPFKPPRMIGFSELLLSSHYEKEYGGWVRKLNAIRSQLAETDLQSTSRSHLSELKRDEYIATNAVILHEVYFDGLGGVDGLGSPSADPTGPLADAIARDFGSIDAWRQQFVHMGSLLGNSSGWVVLCWSRRLQQLTNQWLDHFSGAMVDSVPLIALDLYEHAYQLDFGTDVGGYINTWLDNVHWGRPGTRFIAATDDSQARCDGSTDAISSDMQKVSVEALSQQLNGERPPYVLDVCLPDDVPTRIDKLPNAQFVESDQLESVIDSLPRDRPIMVYCVYGYQVSGNAVKELCQRGFDAYQVRGGLAAWHALDAPTDPLHSD